MKRSLHSSFTSLSILAASLCLSQVLSAQTAPAAQGSFIDGMSLEISKIFDAASPSVVRIQSTSQDHNLSGTGFFIDSEGTILTSASVVGDADMCTIQVGDQKCQALVVSKDTRSGVALLKTQQGNTPFLKMANSDDAKVASGLISVAYAYDRPVSPTSGTVAGFDVQFLNYYFATTHIRVNIIVQPGQIGGPLLNSKGEVVGMIVVPLQGGCYALPSNAARRIIDEINKTGQAHHAWVGIGVKDSPTHALLVNNLFENTPAASSGIQSGDQVVKIGTRLIKKPSDILDAAFFSRVGDKLPVEVIRNGKSLTFNLELTERPENSRAVTPIVHPQGPTSMTVHGQQ